MGHGITIVGSLNADLVVAVRRFPGPGETVTGHDFAVFPGGKGANQAFAAGRLAVGEMRVRMVGQVGGDAYGEWLRQNLFNAAVDVIHVRTDAAAPADRRAAGIEQMLVNILAAITQANAVAMED